jgi:hypothetical protein
METDKLYKALFYVGGGWNFFIATALFVLTGSLPTMIGIEPPRYPIFIQFNLVSIFFLGIMQIIVARHLREHRSFVKMLMCAKLAMGVVLLYAMLVDAPPAQLVGFLAPGIALDVLFGLVFWRFLVYSRTRIPA